MKHYVIILLTTLILKSSIVLSTPACVISLINYSHVLNIVSSFATNLCPKDITHMTHPLDVSMYLFMSNSRKKYFQMRLFPILVLPLILWRLNYFSYHRRPTAVFRSLDLTCTSACPLRTPISSWPAAFTSVHPCLALTIFPTNSIWMFNHVQPYSNSSSVPTDNRPAQPFMLWHRNTTTTYNFSPYDHSWKKKKKRYI